MTQITNDEFRLTAEDVEFVPSRLYGAHHACGTQIFGLGSEMHAAIEAHTADCYWKEPTA